MRSIAVNEYIQTHPSYFYQVNIDVTGRHERLLFVFLGFFLGHGTHILALCLLG